MHEFLFSEFMFAMWGLWGLLAVLLGYIIADGFDSTEEAVAYVGGVALIGGAFSALAGGGFFKGAGEWIKSMILSALFIPAFPCLYLLPAGWRLGEAFQLDFFGCLGTTGFVVLSAFCTLTFAWVAALKVLNQFVHAFFASVMGIFIFTFPPIIAFAVS